MDYHLESQKTLLRLLTHPALDRLSPARKKEFLNRLDSHFERLFKDLHTIYGWQYDFYYHLQSLFDVLLENYIKRDIRLQKKDKNRLSNKRWFKDNKMLGMAVYVDLFGGDLTALKERIPYFKGLGINYLHLMPLYACPDGDSDGGYAVSDYRQVMPKLGDMADLKDLSKALGKSGINLVLDFVFNHTSDEHEWAQKAKNGEQAYQDFYYMFDDKVIPDQYEENLREIFPQVRRGNFTYSEAANKWVWTTFNSFQWDLNYANPAVFTQITSEMLFLANLGCDALRLDALAFIWKEMGTSCENLDKAHVLIEAFNACLQIAAPSVVFKSEAIVHPDEVLKYIAPQACQLSYNPLLMALIWNSLATRKTNLITASLHKSFGIDAECSWVNYARCHDDIGWTFDDSVAADLGINGDDHRQFLNQFYTGRFPGSFANGVAFGENPTTGDCRVCGSLASLCGLESALKANNTVAISDAIKRILLVHAIILSIGGIPLLYAGDDFAMLNDYTYSADENKQHDARWVHRINVSNELVENGANGQSAVAQAQLTRLIRIRQQHDIFGDAKTTILNSHNHHCFMYLRTHASGKRCLCAVNFSEHSIVVPLSASAPFISGIAHDLVSDESHDGSADMTLGPYQVKWLMNEPA